MVSCVLTSTSATAIPGPNPVVDLDTHQEGVIVGPLTYVLVVRINIEIKLKRADCR